MPTDALTDARCKALKPKDKPYKVFDGNGLFLIVLSSGAKSWRLAYRLDGKLQTKTFGLYPEVTLAEARRKRDEIRAQVRDGKDPRASRQVPTTMTMRDASDAYWSGRQDITDAYRMNAQRCMEMHLWDAIGSMPIGEVKRADLLAPLNKMAADELLDYVRKARMWLSQVFDWAIEQELCETNPAETIKPEKAWGKKKEEHFAAVEPRDVGALLDRIGMEDPNMQSVIATRFLAYTWARTTEVRMMTWDELRSPDEWVILGERMKRGKDHIVPLSTQAQRLIEAMRARSKGSRFVFPGDRSTDRPMSENAILYLLHRIGYKGRMTGHGWRSTGSTWANEAGHNPDAIEMQLAHSAMSKTRSAYNRAKYLPERRAMLQAWADWLDAQKG